MGFNGQSLIVIGIILFFFQLVNFLTIDTITPELERAQVLSAVSSIVIILIGFLFKQFKTISGKKVDLNGENKFIFDSSLPKAVINELAWGSETILTSTAAASILIHNNGENILIRGITTGKIFIPGDTCQRAINDMKLISLANTKFYPGREEFYSFWPNIPSVLIVPINKKAFIVIGGWSSRCFTKSDEKWINNWSKKINNIFLENDI